MFVCTRNFGMMENVSAESLSPLLYLSLFPFCVCVFFLFTSTTISRSRNQAQRNTYKMRCVQRNVTCMTGNRIEIALRTNYRLSSDIRREWSKVNKRHWLISSIYHIDAVQLVWLVNLILHVIHLPSNKYNTKRIVVLKNETNQEKKSIATTTTTKLSTVPICRLENYSCIMHFALGKSRWTRQAYTFTRLRLHPNE